jgi:beta-glucosidase/6-phospho-beta-glucosidase/beta-galactosidase
VRFGMVYIDYKNDQKRYVKDSGYWYSEWIKNQTLSHINGEVEKEFLPIS